MNNPYHDKTKISNMAMVEDSPSFEVDFDEEDEQEQQRHDEYNMDSMMDDVTTLNEDDPVDQVGNHHGPGGGGGQMPTGHHGGNNGGYHNNNNNHNNNTNQIYPQESYSETMLKEEKYMYERSAINDAQSVAYTAYTMNLENATTIVHDLRKVGVTVLSLESLSTSAMIHYMDAVTTMRLGHDSDEKCMLYTDRMGRVFNVVISGGAEGMAAAWLTNASAYSGWLAACTIPLIGRVVASYTYFDDTIDTNDIPTSSNMALQPIILLLFFGLVLQNEISHVWLAMSINVRGSNSVGSHVWRTGNLSDYPRILLLAIFTVASTAPATSITRDGLLLTGSILGICILFCNLGSRAWKKLEIGYIDSTNFFSSLLVIMASLVAGLTFPYIGLRHVHGGCNDHDSAVALEKVTFNTDGRRARQNVSFASASVILIFMLSDVEAVQEVLGFDATQNRGVINLVVGTWWFFSTLASLALCHRLDASQSKKIEPFLRRDETSPVGWIVPSVPNIVIDPSLGRGKMKLACHKFGSDILCSIIIAVLGVLIIWMGVRELQGEIGTSFWEIFR